MGDNENGLIQDSHDFEINQIPSTKWYNATLITTYNGSKRIIEVEGNGSCYIPTRKEKSEKVQVCIISDVKMQAILYSLGIYQSINKKLEELIYNNLPKLIDDVAYADTKINGKWHYRLIFRKVQSD